MCRPRASMPRDAARDDGDLRRGAQHDRDTAPRAPRRVLLGVVERARARGPRATPRRLEVEQHRRGDERAGQAAAAGLVGAGDAAEPSPRSNWKSRRPVRRLARRCARAGRCRGSEEADPVGRPVGGEGATDDPLLGDGSPEPAVVGLPTVVAHHEPVPGGNRDRRREVAPAVAALRTGWMNGSFWRLPLRTTWPSLMRDRVARAGDDALDEVHAGLAGRRARSQAVALAAWRSPQVFVVRRRPAGGRRRSRRPAGR